MSSEFLHCSPTVSKKILYKGRNLCNCKNQVLLFHLSLLWNTPTEADHQHCLHRDYKETSFIKHTMSDYTNPQNFLSPSKSWVWAMTTPLSDNSFQYTHIHMACWKFLITRRGCSPSIISDSYSGFSHVQSWFSVLYLVLQFSSLTQDWVLSWSANSHFRSFSRWSITVILTGSWLTGVTRWNLLNLDTTARNSACPGF